MIGETLHKRIRLIIGILITIGLSYLVFFNQPKGAYAWYDDTFSYRQSITFTHNASLSERRITITVNTSTLISSGKMQSDCDDTRFTNSEGKRYRYQLVSGCNTSTTTYYVAYSEIINGVNNAYMYYGNRSVSTKSDSSVTNVTSLTPSGGSASLNTEEIGTAPVTYLSFDEGYGSTAHDLSNNSNSAPLTSTADTGFVAPTHSGEDYNSWTTPANAYTSNNAYAYEATNLDMQDYYSFGFSIPSSATILGIEVRMEASSCTGCDTFAGDGIGVRLSHNGGTTYASSYTSVGPLSSTDATFTAGSTSDTWGRTWVASELDNTNFRVRVNAQIDTFSFPTGSLLLDGNGVYRPIESFSPGDQILSLNTDTHEFKVNTLRSIITSPKKEIYTINDDVKATNDELIYAKKSGQSAFEWIRVDTLEVGDIVLHEIDRQISEVPVLSINVEQGDFDVYTVKANEPFNNYWVNNYLFDPPASGVGIDLLEVRVTYSITGPSWKSEDLCIANSCILFDGSSNVSTLTNNDSIDLDKMLSSGFTLSTWVKTLSDGENNVGQIIQKGTNTYIRTTNEGSDGLMDLEVSLDLATTDASVSVPDILRLNRWQHIAVTYSDDADDEISVYVDGRLAATSTNGVGSPASDSNDLLLGGSSSANYHGYLDEFKVYKKEKTSREVAGLSTLSSSGETISVSLGSSSNESISDGLIGYWPMDEAAANTCSGGANDSCDRSGNGRDGAWNGNSTYTSGKFGNGTSFDGTDDSIMISGLMGNLSEVTLSGWANLTSADSNGSELISLGDCVGLRLDDPFSSAGVTGFNYDGSDWSGVNTGLFVAGFGWHHYAYVVKSASYHSLYIDGMQVANESITTTISCSGLGTNTWIGHHGNGDSAMDFNGSLDEVRVYNRALTASEVSKLNAFAPGPVGYWKMDEGSGAIANDTSGNSTSATITQALWKTAKYGKGLDFDGSNDYIEATDNSILEPSSDISLMGWIKLDVLPTNKSGEAATMFWKSHSASPWQSYRLYINGTDNQPVFSWSNSSSEFFVFPGAGSALVANQWYHIAAIKSGTNMSIYLNGNLLPGAISDATGSLLNSTGTVQMGGAGANSSLDGTLDDLKIYNYARTPSQIIQDMNANHPLVGTPVSGPVGYWKLDEGYGSVAHNNTVQGSSLDANFGTSSEKPAWSNDGKIGKSVSFDGSDVVTVTDNNSIDFGDNADFSISLWVNSTQASVFNNYFIMISKVSSAPRYGYEIGLHDSTDDSRWYSSVYVNGTEYFLYGRSDIADGSWHHIVFERNGSILKTYEDGKLANALTSSTLSISNSSNLNIGRSNNGTPYEYYYPGKLDEIKIYNAALSDSDVLTEYNTGKAIVLGSLSTESDGTTASRSSSREYCVPGDTSTCNPPVGEWQFDMDPTTTVVDTSGNDFNGTIDSTMDAADWVTGKLGKSLDFDGTNDQVTISDSTSLRLTSFTLSSWIYPRRLPSSGNDSFINKYADGGTANYYFELKSSSGLDCGFFYNNSGGYYELAADSSMTLNEWQYVTCTFNNATDTMSIYRNGLLVASGTTSNVPYTTAGAGSRILQFGGYDDQSQYSNSKLDNIRIYDYARTSAQVAWDYNRGAPFAHWKLDEASGSTAYDSSNNGLTGTIYNSPAIVDGKLNNGLSFSSASSQYIEVPYNPKLDITKDLSIAFWIKRSGSGYEPLVLKTNGTTLWDYSLYILNDNRVEFYNESTGYFASTSTIPQNVWTHITFVHQGTNYAFYINGARDNQTTMGETLSANPLNLYIGREGTTYADSIFDDVRLYNYGLTATQVKTVMNDGGTLRIAPVTGSP